MSGRATRGFTLIEVMAVVALLGVVFFFALDFYTDLSRATARASDHTRDIRRATAILDRVARDFEGATLVAKPEALDPILHPWLFVGEARLGSLGSDHIKFVTRSHDPTRTNAPESDLAVVAYTVERDESDETSLYRWSSPRLPESLEKAFPYFDDEHSFLLAEGLSSFAVRFLDDLGGVREEWDSTTLLDSSQLPAAVEIELAMATQSDIDGEYAEPRTYSRRVLLPVRPLDLVTLLDPEGDVTAENGSGTGRDGDGDDSDGSNGRGKGKTSGGRSRGKTAKNDPKDKGGSGFLVKDCVSVTYCNQVPDLYSAVESLLRQSDWPFDPSAFANYPPCMVNPACR